MPDTRDPPLFDWRDQLPLVDAIVARVRAPVHHPPAKNQRAPSPGPDLSPFRDSIAKLLADLQELYLVGSDVHEMRGTPPTQEARDKSASGEAVFDYGDDAGAGFEGWQEIWRSTYARPRGNPGRSRTGGPPIMPLHAIYTRVRTWWRDQSLGRFHPTFAGDDEAEFNAPSRFLLGIVQVLDPAYSVDSLRGLYETKRKSE